MEEYSAILVVALLVLYNAKEVRSSWMDRRYSINDPVPFYASKVGPMYNPSETYAYYDLPFCSPDNAIEKNWSLGDALNGDLLVSSPYKLEFRVNKDFEVACIKTLRKEEIKKFQYAIAQGYMFRMYYDDLPISDVIGRVDYYNALQYGKIEYREIFHDHSEFRSFYGRVDYNVKREDYKYQMFTHIEFQIAYNNDRVISIVCFVSSYSDMVELTEDKEVEVKFTYDVHWYKTNESFEKNIYLYYSSDIERDWCPVMVSYFKVLVLLGCSVMIYVWVLRKNFNKEIVVGQEETESKIIQGDVFRYQKHRSLFASAVGCGTQMIVLVIFVIVVGLLGVFQPYRRGALLVGLVVIYVITSGFAGYVSVSLYSQLQGTNWVQNLFLTGSIFSVPLFITFLIVNSVAATFSLTSALPLGTILVLLCTWVFGALPLLLLGGIAGKYKVSELDATCHTTTCPMENPSLPWYKGVLIQMCFAGMFCFSVVHTELYFLLGSIWGQSSVFGAGIKTTYPILLLVAIVTVIDSAAVAIALTYFQLSSGNHEWRWRSFLCGGSTGLYIFGYCLYFYHQFTSMSGILQALFFFGYMACASYGVFLMLGAVGFYASWLFVHLIHVPAKCE